MNRRSFFAALGALPAALFGGKKLLAAPANIIPALGPRNWRHPPVSGVAIAHSMELWPVPAPGQTFFVRYEDGDHVFYVLSPSERELSQRLREMPPPGYHFHPPVFSSPNTDEK